MGSDGTVNVAIWSLSEHHEKVKYTVKVRLQILSLYYFESCAHCLLLV